MIGKLKNLRLQAGLSQKQVSDLLGITVANISMVERGLSSPDPLTRKRLELFFNTKINFLDIPSIKTIPLSTANWDQAERDFRHLLRSIAGLPENEKNEFIKSATKHLRNLKKSKLWQN
jgi:transcriptional regulator with XRE-family HTH domain